jgi:hypothetical protein
VVAELALRDQPHPIEADVQPAADRSGHAARADARGHAVGRRGGREASPLLCSRLTRGRAC